MTGRERLGDRPLASVSLDADDLWTYLKTRGDPAWSSYPSYHPVFIPRVLQLLDELDARITFFVVGRDAAVPAHAPLFQAVAERGHEIANHSYNHDCWLHRFTQPELDEDLERAEEAIQRATGRRPQGFRGPGFSWSTRVLDTLARRGYRYDATTLPTIVGPFARAYFLRTAPLTAEQREERSALFGSWREAARPLRPYRWALNDGASLLEIPVTTMPVVRVPFHMSYLLYLSQFSWALMVAHLRTALALCRLWRVEPSFLLHPLDVLDAAEAPGLEFFPGMRLDTERKLAVFRYALRTLTRDFDLVPMTQHADAILARGPLPTVSAPTLAAGWGPPRPLQPAPEAAEDESRANRMPVAVARRYEHPSPSQSNRGAT